MSRFFEFNGIKAIILRELIVFIREKERLISSLISPILFLFILGRTFNQDIQIAGYSYQEFIFPGIIGMNILFTSIRYGLYIIWDKRFDFLKEVLVAPISRRTLFIGKALGGVIGAMIEMSIILIIGSIFVVKVNLYQVLLTFLASFLISFMIVSIGLSIGGATKTMEGFGLVMSFVTWPMFIFSNALFEIKSTTFFIKLISLLNPFTYCVDILRNIILNYSVFNPFLSLLIITIWIFLLSFIAIEIFSKIDIQK